MNAGVDEQLREYFHREVPKAFPPCPGNLAGPVREPRFWSRTVAYALAASLLFAVGLAIVPTSQPKMSSTDDPFGRATADGQSLKAPKPVDKK